MRISDWSSDVCSSDLPDPADYACHCAGLGHHASRPRVRRPRHLAYLRYACLDRAHHLCRTPSLREVLADMKRPGSSMARRHRQIRQLIRTDHQALGLRETLTGLRPGWRSEAHTSELQSLMRISYAV